MLKIHRILDLFRNKELNEIYASISLKTFGLSMISIFVPIYLVNLNYTFSQVFIYYAILRLVHAAFAIPAAKIAAKFGIKHSILFSVPFLITYYLLLFSIPQTNIPIYFIACLFGIHNALFWVGYHVDFAKFSNFKERGSQIGFSFMTTMFFTILGPLIGGIVLSIFGFPTLFIIVSLLLLLSTVPLFYSQEIYEPFKLQLSTLFSNTKLRESLSFLGAGIEITVVTVIWPLFLFFHIVNDFTKIGLISSLSILTAIGFVFVSGKFTDYRRRIALKVGATLNSIIWIFRIFINTTTQAYIIDSLYGMTRTLTHIPFDALFYDKVNKQLQTKKDTLIQSVISREITIQIGGALVLLIMCFFSSLTASFGIASAASLLFLLF